MSIPKYIIVAAQSYVDKFGGGADVFNAFVAGFEASRTPKAKEIELSQEQAELFETCWKAYGMKGSKGKAKKEWSKLKAEDTARILRHIEVYASTRERCYQKDFERYLKDETFKEKVFRWNEVAYDPQDEMRGEEAVRFYNGYKVQ